MSEANPPGITRRQAFGQAFGGILDWGVRPAAYAVTGAVVGQVTGNAVTPRDSGYVDVDAYLTQLTKNVRDTVSKDAKPHVDEILTEFCSLMDAELSEARRKQDRDLGKRLKANREGGVEIGALAGLLFYLCAKKHKQGAVDKLSTRPDDGPAR